MRGSFAVIGMVLLVVLVAHLQREEAHRERDDFGPPSVAYHTPGDCSASLIDDDDDFDPAPAAVATVDDVPDAR